MGKAGTCAPRRIGGGYSVRYEERRARSGAIVKRAPSWSDGAACHVRAALQELGKRSQWNGMKDALETAWQRPKRWKVLLSAISRRAARHDAELAQQILTLKRQQYTELTASGKGKEADRVARSLCEILRQRCVRGERAGTLVVRWSTLRRLGLGQPRRKDGEGGLAAPGRLGSRHSRGFAGFLNLLGARANTPRVFAGGFVLRPADGEAPTAKAERIDKFHVRI